MKLLAGTSVGGIDVLLKFNKIDYRLDALETAVNGGVFGSIQEPFLSTFLSGGEVDTKASLQMGDLKFIARYDGIGGNNISVEMVYTSGVNLPLTVDTEQVEDKYYITINLGTDINGDYISTAREIKDAVDNHTVDVGGDVPASSLVSVVVMGIKVYEHPLTHPASIITETVDRVWVSPEEKVLWNNKQDAPANGSFENVNSKDSAGGYVGIDILGKMSSRFIPNLDYIPRSFLPIHIETPEHQQAPFTKTFLSGGDDYTEAQLIKGNLKFKAKNKGTVGNSISVEFINPGSILNVLNVVITGNDIKLSLATDEAGNLLNKAKDIVTYLNGSASGNLIGVSLVDTSPTYIEVAPLDQNRKVPSYFMPIANSSSLGGIRVGNNLSIDENGVLNALNSYVPPNSYSADIISETSTRVWVSPTEKIAWNSKQAALGYTPENIANRNTVNGYAGLSSGKLDINQIPELNYIKPSEKDVANGVAGLDSSNKISRSVIPIASTSELGGIRIGNNLTIDENGVLSALSGYTHPTTHSADMITESATRVWVSPSDKMAWDSKQSDLGFTPLSVLGGTMTGDIIFDNRQPNPSVPVYPSPKKGIIWQLSSDTAGMYAQERGGDNLDYVFIMGDNINNIDRFLWKNTESRGTHADLEAMELLSGYSLNVNNAVNINGKMSLKAPRLATIKRPSRQTPSNTYQDVSIVRNNQDFYDPDLNGSTLTMTVDVSGYNGVNTLPYVIKLKSGGTPNTFCWSNSSFSSDVSDSTKWLGNDIAVSTEWIDLSFGVRVKFNATTGGVVNETLGFTVLPGSSLDVSGDIVGNSVSVGLGGGALNLRAGTVDHTYMQFYARTSTPAVRSGYIGFDVAGTSDITINNEIPTGNISLKTSNVSNGQTRGKFLFNNNEVWDKGNLTLLNQLGEDVTHRLVSDSQISAWSGKQNDLGYVPVNKAGDSMSGYLEVGNYLNINRDLTAGEMVSLYKNYSEVTNEDPYMSFYKQIANGGVKSRYGYIQAGENGFRLVSEQSGDIHLFTTSEVYISRDLGVTERKIWSEYNFDPLSKYNVSGGDITGDVNLRKENTLINFNHYDNGVTPSDYVSFAWDSSSYTIKFNGSEASSGGNLRVLSKDNLVRMSLDNVGNVAYGGYGSFGGHALVLSSTGLVSGNDAILRSQNSSNMSELRVLNGVYTNPNKSGLGISVRNSVDSGNTWYELLRADETIFKYKDQDIWYAGNFSPSSKFDKIGGTLTGSVLLSNVKNQVDLTLQREKVSSTDYNKLQMFIGADTYAYIRRLEKVGTSTEAVKGEIRIVDDTFNGVLINGFTVWNSGNLNPSDYVNRLMMGAINGVATLDGDRLIPEAQIPKSFKEKRIVNSLADRDAIPDSDLFIGLEVHVINANDGEGPLPDDSTIALGWARYMYNGKDAGGNKIWIKIAEQESMDVVVHWEDVQEKPTDLIRGNNGNQIINASLDVTGLITGGSNLKLGNGFSIYSDGGTWGQRIRTMADSDVATSTFILEERQNSENYTSLMEVTGESVVKSRGVETTDKGIKIDNFVLKKNSIFNALELSIS